MRPLSIRDRPLYATENVDTVDLHKNTSLMQLLATIGKGIEVKSIINENKSTNMQPLIYV